MNKLTRNCILVLLSFLILITNCLGAEFIQSFGSVWISGFFETAADITGNDEMVYVADMNNSQIQAYKKNWEPLFHFGGYGLNNGNFIEIHGLYADNTSLYTASIDSFSLKKGRIQVFSKLGIFQKTFDTPDRRSDFLRVTKTRDNLIVGITENTICIYNQSGKLIKETNQALDIPFLFLQDVAPLPDKSFVFIDRGRRGFFIANSLFNKITLLGDEYISIPVAITSFMQKIYVADANGSIHSFSLDGKLLKSTPTNLYINGLYVQNSSTIFATSALRRGIFEIDLTSNQVKEIKIVPTKELELHWPTSIDTDGESAYTNDDYSGTIKILSASNGQFVKQIGTVDQESIKAYDIAVADKNHIFALSKTNSSQIYLFNQEGESQILENSSDSEYASITTDKDGSAYALDHQNRTVVKYNGNQKIAQILCPPSEDSIEGIFVSDFIYVAYQNGDIVILDKKNGRIDSKVRLNPVDRLDTFSHFIALENYFLVSCRESHTMKLYTRSNGQLYKNYGSIGGPKTFVQTENIGVDINYESGRFLFPEGISRWEDTLYVADSGNHRIQKIPLHFLWDKDHTIILQVGSLFSTLNYKTIRLDVAPLISLNRVFVPIRFISEALGAKVDWNPGTQKITISEENVTIEFWIGNTKMKVNNKDVVIDSAPLIKNGRTLVPIRAISETLGGTVTWDGAKQTVTIRR